ncbi:lycopene cyclase family protein [Flavobacterium sp. MK4S-17]|uniref:lycopene cyclase family protein n=1 Tax=Flavobacterium sp. MK4S-17 TaxID=2543737 RepID=UPI00135740E5|nr:lycopene cyclase family protein [Flavobacterium sp. MK4S-17]
MEHYHYIFTGSGLSALMTVYRMVISGNFQDKKILLIDADTKKTNDRTWCYWEQGKGEWDNILYKTWQSAIFSNEKFSRTMPLFPYEYKMIKGIDFYQFVFSKLEQSSNISFLNSTVTGYKDEGTHVTVNTSAGNYSCDKLFTSIYNPENAARGNFPVLQQHFTGWFIKTETAAFNDNAVTFMDFSVKQKGNTRFMYVLPVSPDTALVEYTLFSEKLLKKKEYEEAIREYLEERGIDNYTVTEKESGSIPMTVYQFWKSNTRNILHIGSAGGWTKASTGYTFKNTDRLSQRLVLFLEKNDDLSLFYKKNRFWYYDLLLLDILYKTNWKGSQIFSSMFRKGSPALLFKFLDEQTALKEDIQVILKCPKGVFLKALLRRLTGL